MDIILDTSFTVPSLQTVSKVIAADSFDYSDTTLRPTQVGGALWTGTWITSTIDVDGRKALITATPTSQAAMRVGTIPAISDVIVEATLAGLPGTAATARWAFLAARATDASNMIVVTANVYWEVQVIIAGNPTLFVSSNVPVVGDRVSLRVQGERASLYINNIRVLDSISAPVASLPGTGAGIAIRNINSSANLVGQAWDDFAVRTIGA